MIKRLLTVLISYVVFTKCDSISSQKDIKLLPKYEGNVGPLKEPYSEKDDLKAYEYFSSNTEPDNDKQYYNWNQKYNEEDIKYLDQLYGYTGPTANDEPENLMRPCNLQDWECIRKYFAANGKCKPAYGPIPDPMIFDVQTVYFPLANLTVSFPDGQIRGLSSARVTELYVNKKTGNLVFAFDIQNFNQTLPRAYFRYRRTAKESIILPGYATVNYRSATFTAVIPMVPDLRLDLADVHLDVQDSTPAFFISPEAATSSDPDVQTAFAEFLANIPRAIREGVFFQASLFSTLYIQKTICDFGLKLISA